MPSSGLAPHLAVVAGKGVLGRGGGHAIHGYRLPTASHGQWQGHVPALISTPALFIVEQATFCEALGSESSGSVLLFLFISFPLFFFAFYGHTRSI